MPQVVGRVAKVFMPQVRPLLKPTCFKQRPVLLPTPPYDARRPHCVGPTPLQFLQLPAPYSRFLGVQPVSFPVL